MRSLRREGFAGVCALGCATIAMAGTVDMAYSPEDQEVGVGDPVEVNVIVFSSDDQPQDWDSLQTLMSWDPAVLEFIGAVQDNADVSFFLTGFLNDQDGINDDLTDGDALFTALGPPGNPIEAPAPPDSIIVTTFQFNAVAASEGTEVSFIPAQGKFGLTRVLLAGLDITGDISSVATIVVTEGGPACGDPGTGSCYIANGSPYCDDADCCEAVCAVDSFCCETEWDSICKDQANEICGNCGGDGSGSCSAANGSPGCDDADCCRTICEVDEFCCSVEWDDMCAEQACTLCAGCLGDLNFDNQVNGADLGLLLGNWGNPGCTDLDDSGSTDGADLGLLLGNWGACS